MVFDDKRAQADSKLSKLNNTTREQENAKKLYDEMHIKVEHAHTEVVSVTARLDNMKKNLISDIESLEDLDETISNIDKSIKLYDDKKNELMREVKLKADAYTEVKARLISAKQETEASLERHKEAGERLAKGLLANDFENEDAARAVLIDPDEIERIRNRIAKYYAEVKAADDNLNLLIKELDGRSEPDEEKCNRIVNEKRKIAVNILGCVRYIECVMFKCLNNSIIRTLDAAEVTLSNIKNVGERVASTNEKTLSRIASTNEETLNRIASTSSRTRDKIQKNNEDTLNKIEKTSRFSTILSLLLFLGSMAISLISDALCKRLIIISVSVIVISVIVVWFLQNLQSNQEN